ncbi:MAG: ABC transporter substrate-binding protein, partial [Xanthomonadaceae bacterium]|nr:ABC transporter substrate-binding protein [Xanthomonadaceae bacterium]
MIGFVGRRRARRVAIAAVFVWAVLNLVAGYAGNSPPAVYSSKQASAEQGRLLFERGQSLDQATAKLSGGLEVDAATMPCASCHGIDGRGRVESGFTPTRLWWSMLTRPYETTTQSGRTHGPYSRGTLKRAIANGLDPAGNRLQAIMPRYQFSLRDLENLIAWLRVLDNPMMRDTVRIGLPRAVDGPMQGRSAANTETIAAALAAINARGGVYGRDIELVELDFDPSRSGSLAGLLESADVVALLGGVLPHDQTAVAAVLNARGLPWIGPMSLDTIGGSEIFHLGAGLAEQAGALVDWALASSDRERHWVIMDDGSEMMQRAARQAGQRLKLEGVDALRLQIEKPAEWVAVGAAIQTPATVVLLMPPQSAVGVLA